MKTKSGQVTQEAISIEAVSTETAQQDAVNPSTPGILGTPLLYKVNANTTGYPVAIQNTFTHTLAAHGIFGGGQVNIQWSIDGIVWTPLLDRTGQRVAFTTNALKVGLSFNCIYLRAMLTGATNPQDVTVIVG